MINKKLILTSILISGIGSGAIAVHHNSNSSRKKYISLLSSTVQNQQDINTVYVNNVWNDNLFDLSIIDGKFNVKNGWASTNPYYTSNNSFTIQIMDANCNVLASYTGSGYIEDGVDKSINQKVAKQGDYVVITSRSNAMITAGGKTYRNNSEGVDKQVFEIVGDGFVKISEPTIQINNGVVSVKSSEYNSGKVVYTYKNKVYTESLIDGSSTFNLPNGAKKGDQVGVQITSNGIETLKQNIYVEFGNSLYNHSYNIYRHASISPYAPIAKKGNDFPLTAIEPIPLDFQSGAVITIDVKGSIKGNVGVCINNGTNLTQQITTIPTNTPTQVKIPSNGTLFLNVANVNSTTQGAWSPFTFKANVKLDSGYSRDVPVFDNRTFAKIDKNAYTNNAAFVKDITSPENINYPVIIIGDHLRMYINDYAKTNIPDNINFNNVTQLYKQIFVADNKINGLTENAQNPLNRFHTNNMLVSTVTNTGGGWYTDGNGTFTKPAGFYDLMFPGWTVFHEIGHIFDPQWADDYLHCEFYSNMYTMFSELAVQGQSTWLFSNNQKGFEDSAILPIFENYYQGAIPTDSLYGNYHTGLYYFYLLKEYYPDYMKQFADLYRNELNNGTLPFNAGSFPIYAMAKLYHVNIIPSLEMWGYNVTNQKLIQYVIDNSNTTVNLVPKDNADFSNYNDITPTPTMLNPTYNGNNITIKGIDVPNATINVSYDNKIYKFKANEKGVFTININGINGQDSINVWAQKANLKDSISQNIIINNKYLNTKQVINICDNTRYTGAVFSSQVETFGSIYLGQNGKLVASYSSVNPYSRTGVKNGAIFMNVEVISNDGKSIFNKSFTYNQTFQTIQKAINNLSYHSGDIIKITTPNEEINDDIYLQTGSNSKAISTVNNSENNVVAFYINNNDKLIPITASLNKIWFMGNEISGNVNAPNQSVSIDIAGKIYNGTTNKYGDFTINNVKNLKYNEKVSLYLGNNVEDNYPIMNAQTKGISSSSINISNGNGLLIGNVALNSNNTISVEGRNFYAGKANTIPCEISLLNSNKEVIATSKFIANAFGLSDLSNVMDQAKYNDGDYIKITPENGTEFSVINSYDSNGDYNQFKLKNQTYLYKITKVGLELVNNNSTEKSSNKNNEPKKNSSVNNVQLENQLKLDIASANRMMDNSGYTLGSKNTLAEAINNGNTVLNNKNATSDEITNAINSLISAYKGLVVDTSGLKNDVKEAQTLVNSGNYTKESELSLENAIKEANNLLNSNNITSLGVENAIDELNSAAKSLVVQKKEVPQKVEIENNAQTLYFANISGMESLVINGDIDGETIPVNASKELVIESSNGQVIDTINTTPVNWYSKNKENYSGYQGIISGNILSKLEVGENYKVGIKYDGQVHMLNSKITMPSYGQYRVENSNGNVVVQKSSVIQEGVANCEMGYVYNNGFIINANLNLNGDVIPASAQKQIVITDENGKVVYESNTIPVNWYSSNKNDYSGLQAYIPQSELSKLNATTNYKVSILVTEGSKKYSMPVKGFANVSTDGYKLYDNGDTLSITKVQNVTASAKVEDKYQDGNSTVINAMMNIENVPAGSSAILKVTEKDRTVKEVNGVLVNWYSKDKNNLNGVQFVVNSKIIENAKSSNIVVSIGSKNYNCNLSNI